uniref:Zinc finger C2HC domain-containing protein 1A n=1 Tax=Pseudonaja textilis TaxID=8673 RepID=A0A670YJ92_PSETE
MLGSLGQMQTPCKKKKHAPICQKTAAKKRKTFDSSRQRAEGTDISTVKPIKPRPEPPKKPSNWRRKHQELLAAIRAAKGVDQVLKEGGKLPPPPPPSYDPDYIQCPYCQRRFNENAADRHINFCKEQAARISNKGKVVSEVKGKLPARIQVNKFHSFHFTVLKTSIGAMKPRMGASTNMTRTTGPGMMVNKRKAFGTETYSTRAGFDSGDCSSINGGSSKSNEGNSLAQLPKFCYECGTKYPIESAKYCCECGVRRMIL